MPLDSISSTERGRKGGREEGRKEGKKEGKEETKEKTNSLWYSWFRLYDLSGGVKL
jgi:predicted transposase YdaD